MSLTPVFDAVVADSEPDLFLASEIFPRPGLTAEWVRNFLGWEVAPWQKGFLESRLTVRPFTVPWADRGHRVIRENSILWADSAA